MELKNEHLTRQMDLIPMRNLEEKITIIGAGAIGSFLTLQLAKMGFEDISVWDFDTVSVENMNSQFYRFSDIGKPKVQALYDLVKSFTEVEIEAHNEKFDFKKVSGLSGIVVSAVDCMETREKIFKNIKKSGFNVKFILDPRMSSEFCALYVLNPFTSEDAESYVETLYSNEAAVQEPCTAKSTIYTANLISGLCAKAIKNIVCAENYPLNTQWNIRASKNPMMMYEGVLSSP